MVDVSFCLILIVERASELPVEDCDQVEACCTALHWSDYVVLLLSPRRPSVVFLFLLLLQCYVLYCKYNSSRRANSNNTLLSLVHSILRSFVCSSGPTWTVALALNTSDGHSNRRAAELVPSLAHSTHHGTTSIGNALTSTTKQLKLAVVLLARSLSASPFDSSPSKLLRASCPVIN